MTSAELKALVKDAEYLDHRDVVFAHILIGMVVALENIREEMVGKKVLPTPEELEEINRIQRLMTGDR